MIKIIRRILMRLLRSEISERDKTIAELNKKIVTLSLTILNCWRVKMYRINFQEEVRRWSDVAFLVDFRYNRKVTDADHIACINLGSITIFDLLIEFYEVRPAVKGKSPLLNIHPIEDGIGHCHP